MLRVAVIGSGVAGLSAAWRLAAPGSGVSVTLFEASSHFGGHAHTVDLTLDGRTHPVDTGFLVYNDRTYPGLVRLFGELGVEAADSDMSFSVQVRRPGGEPGLEWSGSSLSGVFAQGSNLLRPRFWGMLAQIVRFNDQATRLALGGDPLEQPLEDFLLENRYSQAFRDDYLLPMVGSIWSCPTDQMLEFPLGTLVRFAHNHGLLRIRDRPQWRTVRGGSRTYVERILARLGDARRECPVRAVLRGPEGVDVVTPEGSERFDEVVFATHPGQALAILGPQATHAENAILAAIRYQPNRAVLHTDASALPSRRAAWAAWNYERVGEGDGGQVCLHYLINRLQPVPWQRPVIVSLNPARPIDPAQVHGVFEPEHPVFDLAALSAQQEVPALQGVQRTWYCGAWCGYGFHEDGLQAGAAVADAILARASQGESAPWKQAA